MRRLVATLTLTAALAASSAPAQEPPTPIVGPIGCSATYTRAELVRHVRRMMRSPRIVTRRRGRRLHRRIHCGETAEARAAARREIRRGRAYRASYRGRWHLSLGRQPQFWRGWFRSTAWCETGGTMDPHAYNAAGPYFSYGQWDLGTWYAQPGADRHPWSASYDQQATIGIRLARREGTHHWPVCGR